MRARIQPLPSILLAFAVSVVGGWLITVFINLIIGTMVLFMESSAKLMDIYIAIFFVLSGYTVPVELFPRSPRAVIEVLPFRFQLGLPVEILVGAYDGRAPLLFAMLAWQWVYVAAFLVATVLVWRLGVRRFSAFGG